jgi:hypothetical protein
MLDDRGGWKGLDTAGVRDLAHTATAVVPTEVGQTFSKGSDQIDDLAGADGSYGVGADGRGDADGMTNGRLTDFQLEVARCSFTRGRSTRSPGDAMTSPNGP